ncbi:MAG TPA: protein kinase [Pirellulaceae bacterium]|nr:protein kinase [Pirellulaceae bacterium]
MTNRQEPTIGLSAEQLLDELAKWDEGEAAVGLHPNAEADSTLKDLKAELDTLAKQLREPAPIVPFEDESDCRRVTELVEALGLEPSLARRSPIDAELAELERLGELGQYRLILKLGQGGMGTVYKALHTKLDKIVALKVLPKQKTSDSQAVARFEREMRAVGKLEHPQIVRAMDANEYQDTHYLVMEYVDGVDLSELVRRVGPLPIADACELVRQAAVGLQHAHEHDLVHRDIKPSNLMLSRGAVSRAESLVPADRGASSGTRPLPLSSLPSLKILDLGLARLHNGHHGDLTSAGQMMGTIDYMAPEQTGDSHDVDIRADIYGLGATLFKLLSGSAPYAAERLDTMVKKLNALATQPVPAIREHREEVPEELAAIVTNMLAKEASHRPATPQEVADALAPFAAGCDLPTLVASYEEQRSATDDSPAKPSLGSTRQYLTAPMTETTSTKVDEPVREPFEATIEFQTNLAPSATDSTSASSVHEKVQSARIEPVARNRSTKIIAVAISLGSILLFGAITLFFQTEGGTIVVELDDPEGLIQVSVVGEDILINDKQNEGEPIKLTPGDHKLRVNRGELEFDSDNFTIKRGEKVVLNVKLVEGQVRVVRDEKIIGQREMPSAAKVVIGPDVPDEPRASPLDKLRREDIDEYELQTAGDGDPAKAPLELVAILGDSRLKHWSIVNDAVFADNAKTLITGGWDGAVRTWDAMTGRQLRVFQLADVVSSVILTPDGKTLIVGEHRTLQFRDVTTGEPLLAPIIGGGNSALALSPDGKKLVTGSFAGDGVVKMYDATSGKLQFRLGQHRATGQSDGSVSDVAIDPQGKVAASASRDMTVKLWDLASGTELRTLTGHTGPVNAVAFSSNGNLLASASHDGTVRLWDPVTGELKQTLDDGTHGAFYSVAFSPDGSDLAVGKDYHESVVVWDMNSGTRKQVLHFPNPLESTRVVAFSPDGKTLMSGSFDGQICLWDLDTGQQRVQPTGPQSKLTDSALSPDGTLLATSSCDGTVTLWDLTQQQAARTIQVSTGHVLCVAFSPDGKILATGNGYGAADYRVLLWDVATGQQIKELFRHGNSVDSLAFTPDGTAVVSGCAHTDLIVIADVTTGDVRAKLEIPGPGAHLRLAVSPDGNFLATSNESRITLWDLTTGNTVHQISHPLASRLAFSPDSKTLASISFVVSDPKLHIWDVTTGEERRALRGHQGYGIGGLTFAPDGKTLWSTGRDGTARQWNPEPPAGTAALQRTIQIGPPICVENLLTITPDGRHLITANANRTIYVLRVDNPPMALPQPSLDR